MDESVTVYAASLKPLRVSVPNYPYCPRPTENGRAVRSLPPNVNITDPESVASSPLPNALSDTPGWLNRAFVTGCVHEIQTSPDLFGENRCLDRALSNSNCDVVISNGNICIVGPVQYSSRWRLQCQYAPCDVCSPIHSRQFLTNQRQEGESTMASPQGITVHDVREQLRSLGHDNVPDSIIEAFLADMRTGKSIEQSTSPPAARQEPRRSTAVPKSKAQNSSHNLPSSVSLARRSRTGGRTQAPPPRNLRKEGRHEFDQIGNVIFDDDEPCEGWSSQEPLEDSYGDIFEKAVRQPVSFTAAMPSPVARQTINRGVARTAIQEYQQRSGASGAGTSTFHGANQKLPASNQDASSAVINAIQGNGTLVRRARTAQNEQQGSSLNALAGPNSGVNRNVPLPEGAQHARHIDAEQMAGPTRGWADPEQNIRIHGKMEKGSARLPEGGGRPLEPSPTEPQMVRPREVRARGQASPAEAWAERSPEAPPQRAPLRETNAPNMTVQMPRWKAPVGEAVPRQPAGHNLPTTIARDVQPRRAASNEADEPRGASIMTREPARRPMSASVAHELASYDQESDDASESLSRVTSSRSFSRRPHAARRKKTDRVARYEALASTWKSDPFLRHQQSGKRAPVNFYRLFEREHAQHALEHEQAIQRRRRSVQASISEHSRYQVPTSKRRDSLRHDVRMWMLSIQQEQPLDP
eukprot:jgi/Mesvir1/6009/Mv00756-RA.1